MKERQEPRSLSDHDEPWDAQQPHGGGVNRPELRPPEQSESDEQDPFEGLPWQPRDRSFLRFAQAVLGPEDYVAFQSHVIDEISQLAAAWDMTVEEYLAEYGAFPGLPRLPEEGAKGLRI